MSANHRRLSNVQSKEFVKLIQLTSDIYPHLSFLSVFLLHAWHPEFSLLFFGRMGKFFYNNLVLSIDVFFVLSSFLLTWLGINEYRAKGNFSFINYFTRRALRIWPLYFLLMLFSFVLLPYVAKAMNIPITLPPASYYLFFISNFYLEGHVYFLRFLWTLSVEEQFYLLWGICLYFFQEQLIICAGIFTISSIAYTFYAICNQVHHDYHTVTYLFDFAIGILAAVILHRGGRLVEWFRTMPAFKGTLFFMALPVLFVILFLVNDLAPVSWFAWIDLAGRYIFVVYMGLFIIEQMVNELSVIQLKSNLFLVYTGKISYGLYCFHGLVLTLGIMLIQKMNISLPLVVQAVLLLAVNFVVAAISYRFVERPFLNMKDRLRRV